MRLMIKPLTRQHWLLLALLSNAALLLILATGLTQALGWSWLGSVSLLFLLSYPMLWLIWKSWQFYTQPIIQLSSYTQMLKEETGNISCHMGSEQDLFTELQQQIEALAQHRQQDNTLQLELQQLFSQLMQQWQQPLCLFDAELQLLYASPAAVQAIQQPMLRGSKAEALGFNQQTGQLSHPVFAADWQCQTSRYRQKQSDFILFSATNISDSINHTEITSRNNLVRVLSHELRNSLTPMASMTATLLSAPQLNPHQTRMVLERIQQRSQRLLAFIEQYAQLNQLPAPQSSWFAFQTLLDEVVSLLPEQVSCEFKGEPRCYADSAQLTQLLINLLKNAVEASQGAKVMIQVEYFSDTQSQYLRVVDNGSGFANLENLFTPFYTTKPKGSGIGLALCNEIARNHGGRLTARNKRPCGAIVEMCWPVERCAVY